MQNILPSKALLIPGMGISEIMMVLLIVKYFTTYAKLDLQFNRIQKIAVVLTIFFIIVYTGTFYIKHYVFYGLGGVSLLKLFIRLFKLLLLTISILLIISKSKDPLVYPKIINGIIYGLIFYSLSIPFSNYFISLGLDISSEFNLKIGEKSIGILKDRAVGLFSGSSGYVAHYLAVGFGFLLVLIERKKIKQFILWVGIISTTIGIIITGSRTGLLTIGIILCVYIFKNINTKSVLSAIFVSMIMFASIINLGSFIVQRFVSLPEEIVEDTSKEWGRFYFQKFYINEIIDNPIYLLTGYTKRSILQSDYGKWRVPHNQYLGMVFWGGFPYLFTFLVILYKIYKHNKIRYKSSQLSFPILYPLIGFCLPYLFDPNEFVIYFPLILSVSSGIKKVNSKFGSPIQKVTHPPGLTHV